MKCGLSVLCAALAASAFALPRVKISDVLAMDADEIAACGKCELEVQVTFNIPWVENAFVAPMLAMSTGMLSISLRSRNLSPASSTWSSPAT